MDKGTSSLKSALVKKGLMAGMGAGMVGLDYYMWRSEGMSRGNALLRAGGEALLYGLYPGLMWPAMALQVAPAVYQGLKDFSRQRDYELWLAGRPALGRGFQDSQAAYTMRQRAEREIEASRLNARAAFGREARFMHR